MALDEGDAVVDVARLIPEDESASAELPTTEEVAGSDESVAADTAAVADVVEEEQ